jgi:tetratricopeptide (TPR) repeat protein
MRANVLNLFIIFIFILTLFSKVVGENIAASNCSDLVTCNDLGMQLIMKGNCSEAIGVFDRITNQSFIYEFNESFAEAWLGKAKAEYCLQRFNATIKICNDAIILNKNNTQFYELEADALLRVGKYEEAIEVLNDTPEISKLDARFWLKMGNALSKIGMQEEALKSYHNATDLEPSNEDAWYREASALFLLRKYEDALASYERYIGLNSSNSKAFYEKGITLSTLASVSTDREDAIMRYQEAADDFGKAIVVNPLNYNASLQKGFMELKLGQYENASASFNNCINLNEKNISAWIGKGEALLKLKRCKESLNAYEYAYMLNRISVTLLLRANLPISACKNH